jgi:hypothetical protein
VLRRIAVLVSLVTLAWTPAAPAAAACSGAWTQTPSPAAHYSEAVAALSSSDAWLLAWDANAQGEDQGFAYQWDGVSWTKITIPEPGVSEYVRGIGAIATDDVWIVGSWQENVTYDSRAYIAHWDGGEFTHFPVDAGTFPRLFSVDGVATDDVWTVGYHHVDHKYRSLAMHWDGENWTEVPTPMPADAERYLNDVDAIAWNDVWAVGSTYTRGRGLKPLALHWDGVIWKNTAPVTPAPSSFFGGVAATSPNRVWAVGHANNGEDALIERWNGTAWKVFHVPNTGASTTSLGDVSVVSGQEAWAAGGADEKPVLYRWNGTAWRSVAVPGSGSGTGYMSEVDSLSDGTSFAAGTVSGHILALQRCPAV